MVARKGAVALDLAPTALLAGQRRAAPLLRGRRPLGLFGLFGHGRRPIFCVLKTAGNQRIRLVMATLNVYSCQCNGQVFDEPSQW